MKILISILLLISTLVAEIKLGEIFPKLTLEDQFSEKREVKQVGATTLLLSFEKDVSAEIKKYLESKEKGFLEANNFMYISDISRMPSFITSMFAIPKMKKFSFKIALIYDEEEAESLSREEGKITVISLEDNVIKNILFIEPNALDSLLNQ